jgi:uncharacterized protein YjbJ (UPF0337 family)
VFLRERFFLANKIKGAVKQEAGKAIGDAKLESEGTPTR